MKKVITVLICAILMIATTTSAQTADSKSKFKQLYQSTVKKLAREKSSTAMLTVNDTTIGIVEISLEKKHTCPCKDKLCHGPRLILRAANSNISIVILPNGELLSQNGYYTVSVTGDTVVVVKKVNLTTEQNEKIAAEQMARNILLQYLH